jgi:hypothetical protein
LELINLNTQFSKSLPEVSSMHLGILTKYYLSYTLFMNTSLASKSITFSQYKLGNPAKGVVTPGNNYELKDDVPTFS